MLTNFELLDIAGRMNIDCIDGCYYKDELVLHRLTPNKGYVINLANSDDENDGTHWTCLYSRKNENNLIEYIYFDSTGMAYPEEVKQFTNQPKIPYNKKNIQPSYNDACGFFILAFLYWINVYENRTNILYLDCEGFLAMFDDMNENVDLIKNEFILSQFFRKKTPINENKYKSIIESSFD